MSTAIAPLDEAAAPRKVHNPWVIAAAVMFSTFLEVLDTTIVNVSLPHIAGSLSASVHEATWVLTSYLVTNAIVQPITGWLAMRIGRKNLLTTSVVGFTLASFCCGLAPTLPLLILFRLLQGAFGGTLQPLSQAVLLETFPLEKRGKAMGIWGLGIIVAPILGPVVGGWLTENYTWRWVFYINLPIGIMSIIMTKLYIDDPPYLKRLKIGLDYWGIGLLACGVGALQIMLDKGQESDWFGSRFIITLLVVSITAFVVFVLYELFFNKHPVVNLRVFKYRNYTAGVLLITVVGFVLYGNMVLLPVWLQTLLGYPAFQAGIATAPRGLGSMIGMPLTGMLTEKVDARKLVGSGLLLGAFTMWQFSELNLNAGYWDFFWPQFIQGLSLALIFVPLSTVTMSQVPREGMGNATSLYSLMRNIGSGVGIAGVATMQDHYQQQYINVLGAHVTATNTQARTLMSGMQSMFSGTGGGPMEAMHQAYAAVFGTVFQQAAVLSYLKVYEILALLFLIPVPMVLLMKRVHTKRAKGEIAAH